jgi:hypothetical protein
MCHYRREKRREEKERGERERKIKENLDFFKELKIKKKKKEK